MSNKETQIQPLALQVKKEQYEKITELSSKLSTYEYSPEKLTINETYIQAMSLLQITEILSKLSTYEKLP